MRDVDGSLGSGGGCEGIEVGEVLAKDGGEIIETDGGGDASPREAEADLGGVLAKAEAVGKGRDNE